jgi:RNA polymerase sigma factor (sigma-70 family)
MSDDDLDALAVRARSGDAAALDALLRAIEPLVAARCRRFFPNRFDAEDATQEALIAVASKVGTFDGRAKFTTWVFRVTTNAAIDTYRTLKRRRSVLTNDTPETARPGSTPSVVVGARIDLLEMVDRLGPAVTEPVLLRDLCDLTYDDIAAVLDVPLGTAKRRIHEGRDKMRRALYT